MTDQPVYTAAEVDAAVERMTDPERLEHAREVVVHAAPGLQRILTEALHEDEYFENAHNQHVADVARTADEAERLQRVRVLVAEEVRLGMLVGVAVGFQLARELQDPASTTPTTPED